MTRELFSADPRVEPADLACGFALFKLIQLLAGGPFCRAGIPRAGRTDQTRGSKKYTKRAAPCTNKLLASRHSDFMLS